MEREFTGSTGNNLSIKNVSGHFQVEIFFTRKKSYCISIDNIGCISLKYLLEPVTLPE